MKRTIQCPHCQAKLNIFAPRKVVKQRCPRCGKPFDVDGDSKPAAAQQPEKAAENKDSAETPENSTTEATKPAAEEAKAKADSTNTDTNNAAEATPADQDGDKKEEEPKPADQPDKKEPDKAETEKSEQKDEEKANADSTEKPGTATTKRRVVRRQPSATTATADATPAKPSPLDNEMFNMPPPASVSFMHIVILFLFILLVTVAMVVSHLKTQARISNIERIIMKQRGAAVSP